MIPRIKGNSHEYARLLLSVRCIVVKSKRPKCRDVSYDPCDSPRGYGLFLLCPPTAFLRVPYETQPPMCYREKSEGGPTQQGGEAGQKDPSEDIATLVSSTCQGHLINVLTFPHATQGNISVYIYNTDLLHPEV